VFLVEVHNFCDTRWLEVRGFVDIVLLRRVLAEAWYDVLLIKGEAQHREGILIVPDCFVVHDLQFLGQFLGQVLQICLFRVLREDQFLVFGRYRVDDDRLRVPVVVVQLHLLRNLDVLGWQGWACALKLLLKHACDLGLELEQVDVQDLIDLQIDCLNELLKFLVQRQVCVLG
jgi:hypothetical protein